MELFHPHARRRRALGASLWALLGLSLLGATMFDTQVIRHTGYSAQSERNRLRPMLVVSAIIENGGHGTAAAQLVAKAADYYLRSRHGLPIDSIQTLSEYMNAGRSTSRAWR